MVQGSAPDVVHDFLGSAQIFTNAVNDLMEEQLHEVTDEQLTFSQLKLLKMVSLTDNYTVSDVAAFLGVSNAAASRAVDRLVKRELVDRAEAEADRRAVRLSGPIRDNRADHRAGVRGRSAGCRLAIALGSLSLLTARRVSVGTTRGQSE